MPCRLQVVALIPSERAAFSIAALVISHEDFDVGINGAQAHWRIFTLTNGANRLEIFLGITPLTIVAVSFIN